MCISYILSNKLISLYLTVDRHMIMTYLVSIHFYMWNNFLLCVHMNNFNLDTLVTFLNVIYVFQRKTAISVSSVQFSHSVMPDCLWPHEPQHTRPPWPSPTPGVHPNPCPLSRRCRPTVSSSVPFSSCPQSFPARGSFQMSQFFASEVNANLVCKKPFNKVTSFLLNWSWF